MKKLLVKLLGIAFIIFPMMLSAQESSIEDLYDKYVGEDGFTSVNISKEMFMLFVQLDGIENEDFQEMQSALAGLNGMKILTYNRSGDETSEKLKKEVDRILEQGKFVELMTVKESNSDAVFMLRKKGDEIIELLLISSEEDQTTLISFFGIIDLQSISKISKAVQIKGMEKFEKINEKYNQ